MFYETILIFRATTPWIPRNPLEKRSGHSPSRTTDNIQPQPLQPDNIQPQPLQPDNIQPQPLQPDNIEFQADQPDNEPQANQPDLNPDNQAAAVQPANHQHDAAQLQDGHPQLVGDQNVLQIPAIKPKLQAELILKPELRRSPRKNKGTPPKYLKDYIC
jgi:hypothetical protein